MSSSPLLKKRKVESKKHTCVICSYECEEKQRNPKEEYWHDFKERAREWMQLRAPKYSHVYEKIKWENGPIGVFWHKDCKWQMMNKRTLEQATRSFNLSHASSSLNLHNVSTMSAEIKESTIATRNSTGPIHTKNLCIWCRKSSDHLHQGKENFCTLSKQKTWENIIASVPFIEDVEIQQRLQVLVNSTRNPLDGGICYHDICFKTYMRPVYCPKITELASSVNYDDVKQKFFKHVHEKLFVDEEVRTLKSLTKDYEDIRVKSGIKSEIKTSYVKDLLRQEFGKRIKFKNRDSMNKSSIVFSQELTGSYIESAVNFTGMKTEEILKAAAERIREELKKKPHMEFPPNLADLTDLSSNADDDSEEANDSLRSFLSFLIDDKKDKDSSQISFLRDALETLVTGERTELPLMLSVAAHGLTRSKEIVQLLYDAGVGVSYNSLLRLYDTWAYNDLISNPICPEEIVEGIPGTVIVDNDDFDDDDLTGENTSHRTNMMFLQPEHLITKVDGGAERMKKCQPNSLKDIAKREIAVKAYVTKSRGEPSAFEKIDTSVPNTDDIRKKFMLHALARCDPTGKNISPDEQKLGAFSGFVSSMSPEEPRSKPYFHCTIPKAPSKSVIATLMDKAVAAAEFKKMPFIQFVGDLPVFVHVEELKAENPNKYKLIVPVLGSFHTQAAYMKIILKRFNGSGIKDLLVNAGAIAEGSVEQALKGKHYNRAQRLYKLLYEALARQLIKCGEKEGIVADREIRELIGVVRDTDIDSPDRLFSMEMVLENRRFQSYVDELFSHMKEPENHMANYILSLMEMIEVLFFNIDSIRMHNWSGYLRSLRLMMPWFTIYDGTNYGRWLPIYWLGMKNLPTESAAFMPKIFAQSMTNNPYSALPPDMWIECTMNKGSKLKSGWKRLLRSEKGLLVHIKNANNVNAVRNALNQKFSMLKSQGCHKENVKSRLKADETVVQELMSLFTEWQCDPFDRENQHLRSMQSGMLATEDLIADFESALAKGEIILDEYFNERLFAKLKSIYVKMPRNNRLTFAKLMDTTTVSNKEGAVTMETKAIISMIELARKENPALFHDMWNYRITDHCLPVFNANGTIRKCKKSKLVDMLKFVQMHPKSYIPICDMGLIWRLATPTSDDRMKGDETMYSWHDYAMKVYNLIVTRHRNAEMIILVNDYYGDDVVNVKDGEHANRAKKYFGGESPNVFPVSSAKLPGANAFSAFFKNKGNKCRLQAFLKSEFSRRAKEEGVTMLYCTRGECLDISKSPVESKPIFANDHIEADTSIFYVLSRLQMADINSPVVIDSEDTDVVALSAYVASSYNGVLAIKRKKGLFDCKQLCNPDMAKIIVRLHVMTGCDSVSSFFGIGKKAVWNKTSRSPEARQLLLDSSDEALLKFTIRYVYNDQKSTTLAEMREKKWKKMKKKSLARVGIDEDTCTLRNKRVRYQCNIFENYAEQFLPSCPLLNGGYTRDGTHCIPVRYTRLAMPDTLVSRLISANEENNCESDKNDTSEDGEKSEGRESENEESDDSDPEDEEDDMVSTDTEDIVDSDGEI